MDTQNTDSKTPGPGMTARPLRHLSERKWKAIELRLPTNEVVGRPRAADLREYVNVIFNVVRTGFQSR